jgi:multiple sugar transport system permease protein
MKSQSKAIGAQKILVQAVLILLSIAFIFPFLWLLTTAVKPIGETMASPPVWIPSHWEFDNFWKAIERGRESLGYYPMLV